MQSNNCPSEQQLLAFHLGTMPASEIDAVAEHLETCATCEAAVQRLDDASDPVLSVLHKVRETATVRRVPAGPDSIHTDTQRLGPVLDGWPCLPGYEVHSPLGRGGMGVVYRARHLRLNRLLALKELRPSPDRSLARSLVEAELVARLHHPNIVQIYEVIEHEGRAYLALELIEGGHLGTKVAGKPQPPRETAELLEAIARAVHHAHEQGIVHRDLKPANVLLTTPAKPQAAEKGAACGVAFGVPKITDFGVAKQLTIDLGETREGDVIGTPAYMSPEQAAGKTEIGPATDVYSLGVILYEMLTGRVPLQGLSTLDTLVLVRNAAPVPPRRLQPKIPRDLETICLKCLEKEPARRYATAADLADDLNRFLEGRPIHARPVGMIERAGKWARRYPGWAALAAVLAVVVAAGLPGVTALWLRAERARAEAQEQQRLADEARQMADQLRKGAEHREARLALERGHELCRRGSLGKGLLWLARSLELAERAGDADLQRAVRINLADWRGQLGKPELVLATPGRFQTTTLSPDGKKAIVAAGVICRELDVASGAPAGPPMVTLSIRHGEDNLRDVRCVAYSRDGKVVLVARSTGGALLWDVARRRNLHRIAHGAEDIWAIDFSTDDKTFLTVGTDELGPSVRFWDRASGKPVAQPIRYRERVWGAAFSPAGKLVVTVGEDRLARFWDWRTGAASGAPLLHQDQVVIVKYSPDGKAVLTGCRDGTVHLWDVQTRQPLGPPVFHLGDITALAFRPDGRAFLTGSLDRSARLWHAQTRQPLATFHHEGAVKAVAFSPDGKTCLTGGADDTVRLWRLPTELSLGAPLVHNQTVFVVALSPDDRLLLTASKDQARLWSVPQFELLASWGSNDPSQNIVRAAALAPDGRTVALGRWQRGASLYGYVSPDRVDHLGPPVGKPFKQDDMVPLLAFGRSAKQLLARRGAPGERVELWERWEGALELLRTFDHPANVGCLAVGPGGELLTGCENRTVYVWNTEGKQVAALAQPDAVHAVALSKDGTLLAGCADGTARLWDVSAGRLRAALHHQGDVLAVAFSPDGKTALTGSADQTVRLWDVATAAPLGPPRWHAGAVPAVAFTHRGDRIVSGSHDRTAQFWRGTTEPLTGDRDAIKAWAEVLAGAELGPDGAESALGAAELARRRKVAGALLR